MKFFLCIFCSIFFFISSIQLLPLFLGEKPLSDTFRLVHGGLFLLIPFTILYSHLNAYYHQKLNYYNFNTFNLHWYKTTYPNHVNTFGDIKCFQCNSYRIHSTRLYYRTYQVSQTCKDCGKFLFYAPEK